jgi:hypothetical protein
MKSRYEHTQFSVFFLVVFSAVLLFVALLVFATHFNTFAIVLFGFFLLVLVTFLTLTLVVTGERVELRFGPGLLRKTIALKEIENVCVVQNTGWEGLGIHWTPNGWVYNVAGTDAVQVELKNGRALRIGTDEPILLAKAIEDALMEL